MPEPDRYPAAALAEPLPVTSSTGSQALAQFRPEPELPQPAKDPGLDSSQLVQWISSAITLELLAYSLIAASAVGLHFSQLDFQPLNTLEAAQALDAYRLVAQGLPSVSASPFLLTVNSILFFLLGASDWTARLAPALAGTVLVLLPWLFRRELGHTGAIVAAVLLALSPSLTFDSRHLAGELVSVTASLAAVGFYFRYQQDGRIGAIYAAAISVAIALTAGRSSYTVLLACATWFLFSRLQAARTTATIKPDSDLPGVWPGSEPARHSRGALFTFGAAFVVLATTLMLNRLGLASTFNLAADWLVGLAPFGNPGSALNLFIVYEPLALVFGVLGAASILRDRAAAGSAPPILALLTWWATLSFLLTSLAAARQPGTLSITLVPLLLLAGWFLGRRIDRLTRPAGADQLGLVPAQGAILLLAMILAAYSYLQVAHWLSTGHSALADLPVFSGQPEADLVLLGLVLLASVAVVSLYAFVSLGPRRAGTIGLLVICLLLVLSSVRGLWQLNFSGEPVTANLITGSQTSNQVRDLLQDLGSTSRWRANDTRAITIAAQTSLGPVIEWYLRVFPNTTWTGKPSPGGAVQALVTDDSSRLAAQDWIFQDYQVSATWQTGQLQGAEFWRWLFFRTGGTQTIQKVRLWVPRPQ